jgi:hypothetical protein
MIDDNFGLSSDAALTLPRGRKGLVPFRIDLTAVLAAEKRIPEMQRSNPMTFPELATVYNIGICTLTKIISIVQLECKDARRELDEARAIFRLDLAEGILASKKIKSSVDARDDASKLDPDVKSAQSKYDILSTIDEYLQNKRSDLERVYYGAKNLADLHTKIPDGTNYAGREK